jgi:putative ATPase
MQPLAEILRPQTLDLFVGQEKLVGEKGPIRQMLESGNLASLILWGPPASGKTTLAHIFATKFQAEFVSLSAVMDGKEDLRKVLDLARENAEKGLKTILFIDEIHRWNKAQQDALLADVESGLITLIGATTENPSFSVNPALLSRCRVFVLTGHSVEDIQKVVARGYEVLSQNNISGEEHSINKSDSELAENPEMFKYIAEISGGDLRFALNTLELAMQLGSGQLNPEIVQTASQKSLLYDKTGEEHYNIISAMHKSLRASNPTAGVYWVMRMLASGEDPRYVARRMLRFASEDIGNANPNALLLANQVYSTVERLGMPECETALVQLADYLARSPKDNSAYMAVNMAKDDIRKFGSLPVPLHFRNAPTKLMKDLNYGKGYIYDHDVEGKKSGQECLPPELKGRNYFD